MRRFQALQCLGSGGQGLFQQPGALSEPGSLTTVAAGQRQGGHADDGSTRQGVGSADLAVWDRLCPDPLDLSQQMVDIEGFEHNRTAIVWRWVWSSSTSL